MDVGIFVCCACCLIEKVVSYTISYLQNVATLMLIKSETINSSWYDLLLQSEQQLSGTKTMRFSVQMIALNDDIYKQTNKIASRKTG